MRMAKSYFFGFILCFFVAEIFFNGYISPIGNIITEQIAVYQNFGITSVPRNSLDK